VQAGENRNGHEEYNGSLARVASVIVNFTFAANDWQVVQIAQQVGRQVEHLELCVIVPHRHREIREIAVGRLAQYSLEAQSRVSHVRCRSWKRDSVREVKVLRLSVDMYSP
jgi:hypothetical protein